MMKGRTFLEAGYVFAPYVPLQMGPAMTGPPPPIPQYRLKLAFAGLNTISRPHEILGDYKVYKDRT